MLWGTQPSQASGDEAAPAYAPRKPSAHDTQRPTKKRRLESDLDAGPKAEGYNATTEAASTNRTLAVRNTSEGGMPTRVLTILDLPDEILGMILEFCSRLCCDTEDFWRKNSLSSEAVKWRAVCRRFKKVYDTGGFLKRTGVRLLTPSQFTRFTRNPAGLKPIDLFSGDLRLGPKIVKNFLCQKKKQIERSIAKGVSPVSMKQTPREKMLWQHHNKGGAFELCFPYIDDGKTFAEVGLFTALPVTSLNGGFGVKVLNDDAFKGFTELTNLYLNYCDQLQNIKALGHCKHLKVLDLGKSSQLTTLAGLEQCQALEVLRMECLESLEDINVLAKLPALKKLRLEHLKIAAVPCIPPLKELTISYDLTISKIILTQLPALKKLTLHDCNIQDILCKKPHDSLHTLRITSCQYLADTLFLTQCHSLKNLFLSQNHTLESLSPCESLTHVHLEKCEKLVHIGALALSTNLMRVTLVDIPVAPLGELSGLEDFVHLALKGSSARDPNLLPTLQKLPSVKRLTLDCAPDKQQALQDYCDTQKIQVRFGYKGP